RCCIGRAIVRLRLDIAYDGTDFHGWAAQPGLRTVEGVLSDSLARITRHRIALTCAGRTDAGVHARGQVAHCDLDDTDGLDDIDVEDVYRRLNRILPDDITVSALQPVICRFDARFVALACRYHFRICDVRTRLIPVRRHDITLVAKPLDTDAMNAAAHFLVGEHDLAAFCKARTGGTTFRTLLELSTRREAHVIKIGRASCREGA